MLVFNPEWEKLTIPLALEEMRKGLTAVSENKETGEGQMEDAMQVDVPPQPSKPTASATANSTNKLAYIPNGAQPCSPSSINKSISLFLAKNQARNDSSNRAEFLSSLADSDIRRKSCARVDAKAIDRDAQMKYDIAKDDYGPLSRSAKAGLLSEKGKMKSPLEGEGMETKPKTIIKQEIDEDVPSARYPGLDERLKNIEDHIAVRFVPNPPRTLLARLKFLEDHLVKLEKEYPPWAALHFNQPGRGWPPPPRTTPIIVPVHLRDTGSTVVGATPIDPPAARSKPTKTKNKKPKSSLHRAVMERLEVQKAMSDLT